MTDLTETLARGGKAPRAKASSAKPRGNGGARKRAGLSEAKLLEFAELLFFAYRDFTRDPDAILKDFGFGRAHHRVLHFVNRHSGLSVADLLDVLTITKQSLSRVLKQLIDKGYIVQRAGRSDRRQRLLFPTEKGRVLAERLAAPQSVRLAEALKADVVAASLEHGPVELDCERLGQQREVLAGELILQRLGGRRDDNSAR